MVRTAFFWLISAAFAATLAAQSLTEAVAVPNAVPSGPKFEVRAWVFNFDAWRFSSATDFEFRIDQAGIRRRQRKKVQRRPTNAVTRTAPVVKHGASDLDRERYRGAVEGVSSTEFADGDSVTMMVWAGGIQVAVAARKDGEGHPEIRLTPIVDDFGPIIADKPLAVTAEDNIFRFSRDDRPVRTRVPYGAVSGFVVIDVVGEDEHAWNLEPFEDETEDVHLLRHLLLRYDEDPKRNGALLLEVLRLVPATLEMSDVEAERLLEDLKRTCSRAIPADRLRIELEQAAMMAGIEKAVPTNPARWTDTDEVTNLDFAIYRDLAHFRRLPKSIRAYALTRSLAHSTDPRYNDTMLREIDSGAVIFDKTKSPHLLDAMRAEKRNRNPATLVPLALSAVAGMIAALMIGRRVAHRLLVG